MNIPNEARTGLDDEALAKGLEAYIEAEVRKRTNEALEQIEDATARHLAKLQDAKAPEPLWTIEDVAEYLGVSSRQVHYFLAGGQLTSIRVGRQHRFEPKAVQRAARGGLQTCSA
jgi:excisionase family DNA binding protein